MYDNTSCAIKVHKLSQKSKIFLATDTLRSVSLGMCVHTRFDESKIQNKLDIAFILSTRRKKNLC